MCLICIELAKGRLRPVEARRNLAEMIESLEPEHVPEVEAAIEEAAQREAAAESEKSDRS